MFNKNNFKKLANILSPDTPCVSMFIPTHRAGHVQKDMIQFKNALADAKERLQNENHYLGNNMTEKEAKGFLTPAYDLMEDKDFWLHLSDGLAIFIGKNHFKYYLAPVHFNSLVYVKNHFYLRPLMPLLNTDDRFFILALSQGQVRFFEGRQYSITPVKIKDLVPANFDEAMAYEDPDKTLQAHQDIYHGHGLHKDQKGWQLEQYCRMVDDGLMKMLHDEDAPMIIAGVDELVAVFKSVSKYGNIAGPNVSGNVENDDPTLLHEKAWNLMKDHFNEKRNKEKETFEAALAEEKASSSILEIVPNAINGKIKTLILAKDAPVLWGDYSEKDNLATIHENQHPHSVCLYNLAAIKTFEQGGKVIHIAPEKSTVFSKQANAIYRY